VEYHNDTSRMCRVNENTVFMTFRLRCCSLFRRRVGRRTLFFFQADIVRRRRDAVGRHNNNVIPIKVKQSKHVGRTDGRRMCACDPTGPRRRRRRFLFRSRPWPKGLAPTTTRPPSTMRGLSILV